jgi:type I restriction enzyme S subunit
MLKHLLNGLQSDKAAVPGLDRNVAHCMPVDWPARSLREDFNAFATDCYRQTRALFLQNQKLRAARDLLLPRLMSGEITV